jgi:DNA-binding transcriptional regulator YiaG
VTSLSASPALPLEELARLRSLLASGCARELRAAAGLSTPEVADEVGVARFTVLRWEAGTQRPRRTTAAARYLALLDALAGEEVAS